MTELIRKVWDFEFEYKKHVFTNTLWIKAFVWLAGTGFAFITVFLIGTVPATDILHPDKLSAFLNSFKPESGFSLRAYLPHIWLILAVSAVLLRASIIISSYYLGKKQLGEEHFNKLFGTYLATFFLGMFTLLILAVVSIIHLSTAGSFAWIPVLIERGVAYFNHLISVLMPFSFGLQSYWLAILLTIILSALPGYIVHYLSHRSRLLWITSHRAHHVPEFLHPLAAPNNNMPFMETLMAIPGVIFMGVVSKMIYHEPLVMEIAVWFTARLCVESFNHSSAHYYFALNNPIVRNLSRLFGDIGVYHLVHHSAYKRDQNVNFSAAPFMIWDRIFGTFRSPYKKMPPLGLTDQPTVTMSPIRIVFGGFAQLCYELKMNKDWKIRWKILFGDVFYMPPVSKDYLVLKKAEVSLETPESGQQ
jgi:sterol desaturase/sphingolipid hydroxylase (fatty acid hydroxylase superfamily)